MLRCRRPTDLAGVIILLLGSMPVIVGTGRSGGSEKREKFSARHRGVASAGRSHKSLRLLGADDGLGFPDEHEKEAILSRAFQPDSATAQDIRRQGSNRASSRFTACCSRNASAVGGDSQDEEVMHDRALHRVVSSAMSRLNNHNLRTKIYLLLTEPSSSWAAWFTSLVILFLIVLSSTTFCMETVQGLPSATYYWIGVVEWVTVIVFTVEYCLKVACAPNTWAAIRTPFNIIDLVAVLPFYIGLIANPDSMYFWKDLTGGDVSVTDTSFIRVIRLVRVFRVLKLSKSISRVDVIVSSVIESIDMLVMLLFLLVLATVLCSTLIYYAETGYWEQRIQSDNLDASLLGPNGDPNPFGSIPECFWWCIVTLMTVGYGDVVPVTEWGKAVACFAMLVSIIIMALPISVIGAAFTQQWVAYKSQAGVIERSQRVWPRFQALNNMMSHHNSALEDFVQKLHNSTRHTDVALVGFRHDADTLMEHADVKCEEREAEGSVRIASQFRRPSGMSLRGMSSTMENMTEHQALLRQVSKAGFFANRSWHILNDMRVLSTMTQSEMAKIERAHFAYKSLKKWYDEGNVLQEEISELLSDLQEVKNYLLENSRQTNGSSKKDELGPSHQKGRQSTGDPPESEQPLSLRSLSTRNSSRVTNQRQA